MPEEIIRACGARPIRLCSNTYVNNNLGEFFTPVDMCPSAKSVIGNLYADVNCLYKNVELFISPIMCDCKKNLLFHLSNYKETMPLYIPYRRNDDDGIQTYIKNLMQIASKISDITGKKITRESLKREMLIQSETQKEILLFSKLKSNSKCLINGTQSLLVMNSLAYDDINNWTKHLKLLNKELINRKNDQQFKSKKKSPRILLAGSQIGFPNIKIPLIVEQLGATIVADETCLSERSYIDLLSISEDTINGYYRALANRYIKPCGCAVFPNNITRINKINEIVSKESIDGIIYHTFNNCLIYDYEYYLIEEYFSKMGIPVIRIESDCGDEDSELISNRVSAFLEMIKFKSKEK